MDAVLAALGVVVAAGVGGLVTLLTVRRTASGRIGTSEAATLWAASENMRADLTARLDKAVEQRDRLLESQAASLIPVLAGINESLRQITESLARLEGRDGQ